MTNEISAEMLLDQLYPGLQQTWTVRNKGTFYRNYSADAMEVSPEEHMVELSRDSMLMLMPSEMISSETELVPRNASGKVLKGDMQGRYEQLVSRLHLLMEAFMPMDTFKFRRQMKVERKVQEILESKMRTVLLTCFGLDIDECTDEYVRQAAMLLPYIARLRGNTRLVRRLLELITGHRVTMRMSAYGERDNTRAWMTKLHYDVMIPGLDAQTLKEETERLTPLFGFLTEHFIPMDAFCEMKVTGVNGELLNYNAYVR